MYHLHALHEGDGIPLQHDAPQLLALVALHVYLTHKKNGVKTEAVTKLVSLAL